MQRRGSMARYLNARNIQLSMARSAAPVPKASPFTAFHGPRNNLNG